MAVFIIDVVVMLVMLVMLVCGVQRRGRKRELFCSRVSLSLSKCVVARHAHLLKTPPTLFFFFYY